MSFNNAKTHKALNTLTPQVIQASSGSAPIQTQQSVSIITDFESQVPWSHPLLLGRLGWVPNVHGMETAVWRQGGKFDYLASTNTVANRGQLVVFAEGTPFVVNRTYGKFSAYAQLHHNGQYGQAAMALRELGYGPGDPHPRTHQGGVGYTPTATGELFLLATSNFFSQDTFYEPGNAQAARFVKLVHKVATSDPMWLLDFIPWLRQHANQRTASLVAGLEAVKAILTNPMVAGRLDVPVNIDGKGLLRKLARAGLSRVDEAGEAVAYWTSRYGKNIPKPVKRAIADFLNTNLTETSALKHDSDEDAFKLADVIRLVHPKGVDAHQNALLKWLVANRYEPTKAPKILPMIAKREKLMQVPVEKRRAILEAPEARLTLGQAGMTWEALAGWLQAPMDKLAWEVMIPTMGYMALLRNLRNFDQAGVSDEVAAAICAKLSNPGQVASSRQLPMRFLSAYRQVPSLRWGHALGKALDLSLANVPSLPGNTLVMVDTSGSMNSPMSDKSQLIRWDAAAQFGMALAVASPGVELYAYSSQGYGNSGPIVKQFHVTSGSPVLKELERWNSGGFNIGGGTPTTSATAQVFKGHDRVIIITDGEPDHKEKPINTVIPAHVPLYIFDIGSYRNHQMPTGPNRHILGGLTDHMFGVINHIEAGKAAAWPWNSPAILTP